MSEKWSSLQAMRGIGCIAVLLAHMMYLEANLAPGDRLLPTFDCLSLSALDLFFVMSGFAMVQALQRTRGKSQPFLRFMWQRMARIYPLYWFYTALLGLSFLAFPDSVVSQPWKNFQGSYLKATLLLPPANGTVLLVGWTLVHEIYFYLALAVIGLVGEKHLPRLLAVWAALVVVGRYTLLKGPALWPSDAVKLFTDTRSLQFIAGCLAGIAMQKTRSFSGRPVFWTGLSIAVLGSLLEGFGLVRLSSWPRLTLVAIPLAFSLMGLVAAERQGRPIRFPCWLIRMGDASYSTYLSHMLVITLVAELWMTVAAPGYLDNAIAMVFMVGASLLVGEMSFRYVESPLLTLTAWPPMFGAWNRIRAARAVQPEAELTDAESARAIILTVGASPGAEAFPATMLAADDGTEPLDTEPTILRFPSAVPQQARQGQSDRSRRKAA